MVAKLSLKKVEKTGNFSFELGGIQAVAQRAGVSIATVSRVLNGINTKSGLETSARVRQAAEDLGYRPAHAGRALRMRLARRQASRMRRNVILWRGFSSQRSMSAR